MRGYGWTPYFIESDDPMTMHQTMAATLDACLARIHAFQREARMSGKAERCHWPMIVLRTPKGWTGPVELDGKKVEGFWRTHQVPLSGMHDNPAHLKQLEDWLRSYKPEELFDGAGRLIPELRALAPEGMLRMSANPHANGGLLRRALRMPDFRDYALDTVEPGKIRAMNTKPTGELLRDVMAKNMDNFRVFGPDENTSNKLDAIYEVSKKLWLCDYKPEDADGGELSPDGRVLEMLSEHTLEGWYEGYVLTGRHGFFATYEAFVHVIDSMYNQHAKWLAICEEIPWRARISSLNLLITSIVWRRDHNGFTHQDPGFLDVVVNKNPEVTRIYLPPDLNTLLATVDHCLQSRDDINVIVADKPIAAPTTGTCTCAATKKRAISTRRWSSPSRTRSTASAWPSTSSTGSRACRSRVRMQRKSCAICRSTAETMHTSTGSTSPMSTTGCGPSKPRRRQRTSSLPVPIPSKNIAYRTRRGLSPNRCPADETPP